MNRERLKFIAASAGLAMQVDLGIGSLYDLPVGAVLTVTSEEYESFVAPF